MCVCVCLYVCVCVCVCVCGCVCVSNFNIVVSLINPPEFINGSKFREFTHLVQDLFCS